MANLLSSEIFDSILPHDEFEKIVDRLKQNKHSAFDFMPFCGEPLFAKTISKKLEGAEFIVFHLDLRMITAPWHFSIELARALASVFEEPSKKAAMIKRLAVAGPIRVGRDDKGKMSLDISSRADITRFISTLFDIPEVTGMEENSRSIMLISGFERIEKILGTKGIKAFYQKVGRQAVTSYVVTGIGLEKQAKKMEENISNQVETVFAKNLFPDKSIAGFIKNLFSEKGKSLTENMLSSIMEISKGRVELSLQLAGRLLGSGNEPDDELLQTALSETIESSSHPYSVLWNMLNSRQKSLLFGLSRDDGKSLYSEEFITKYGFGTATNLQAALRGLNTKSIVIKIDGKWCFADPFLKLWIQRANKMSLHG